ncbi:hypothetical protein MP228_012224 [Amoeboaphelidium protococcarum]|nr:hypothetical protein MP228_012224 [Amoeboaphelidium protococcarum]
MENQPAASNLPKLRSSYAASLLKRNEVNVTGNYVHSTQAITGHERTESKKVTTLQEKVAMQQKERKRTTVTTKVQQGASYSFTKSIQRVSTKIDVAQKSVEQENIPAAAVTTNQVKSKSADKEPARALRKRTFEMDIEAKQQQSFKLLKRDQEQKSAKQLQEEQFSMKQKNYVRYFRENVFMLDVKDRHKLAFIQSFMQDNEICKYSTTFDSSVSILVSCHPSANESKAQQQKHFSQTGPNPPMRRHHNNSNFVDNASVLSAAPKLAASIYSQHPGTQSVITVNSSASIEVDRESVIREARESGIRVIHVDQVLTALKKYFGAPDYQQLESKRLLQEYWYKDPKQSQFHEFKFPYMLVLDRGNCYRPVFKEFVPSHECKKKLKMGQELLPNEYTLPYLNFDSVPGDCPFYPPESSDLLMPEYDDDEDEEQGPVLSKEAMKLKRLNQKPGNQKDPYGLFSWKPPKLLQQLTEEGRIIRLEELEQASKQKYLKMVQMRDANMSVRKKKSDADAAEQKPGFCEVCQEKFADLVEHCASIKHKDFINDDQNYVEVDALIGQIQRPIVVAQMPVDRADFSLADRVKRRQSRRLSTENNSKKEALILKQFDATEPLSDANSAVNDDDE